MRRNEEEKPYLTPDEKMELAKHYSTQGSAIDRLLEAGVKPEDVGDVLEIRDTLHDIKPTGSLVKDKYGRLEESFIEDTASIDILFKSYLVAGKDVELLEAMADLAQRRARGIRYGGYTKALREVIDEYKAKGDIIFDED